MGHGKSPSIGYFTLRYSIVKKMIFLIEKMTLWKMPTPKILKGLV